MAIESYKADLVETATENKVSKRYTLSKEEFAKQRMGIVKETIDELKKLHPEVLSFTMFGSMTKGKARLESDIDGYLFVDAEAAQEQHVENNEPILIFKEEEREPSGIPILSFDAQFREDIQNTYSHEIRDRLQTKGSLADDQVEHVRVLPISKDIINSEVDALGKWATEMDTYERAMDHWKSGMEDKNINYEQLPELPTQPTLVLPSVHLYAMFHLDIGGGIKTYRNYLIEKLGSMGSKGERIWKEIIKVTENMEQGFQSNIGKRYPRTLKDAQNIYSQTSKFSSV